MSDSCGPPAGEQPCGCCTGVTLETPEAITNRPALSSISYRVGTYATFDASMLASLTALRFPDSRSSAPATRATSRSRCSTPGR